MPHQLDSQRLPLVIAVTGHRDLRPDDEPILARAVDEIFAEFQARYPATPLLLLTPLAEGADQLVAEVARRRAIPYRVPIPMPLENYREDFSVPERLAAFEALLRDADGPPYAVPFLESNNAENIADARRRADQYALLAAHLGQAAHVFIALWDGAPSDEVGGTAQAVRFRVLGVPARYRRKSLIDEPETGPVYHVVAARRRGTPTLHPAGHRALRIRRAATGSGTREPDSLSAQFDQIDELPANAPDPFAMLFGRIDTFNTDAARLPPSQLDAGASATSSLRSVAENVATSYQRKFVRALQTLFFATAVSVLSFLSFADLFQRAYSIVFVYLAATSVAIVTYLRVRRGRWQDRAQDYRALEIGLQVQNAWDAAGVGQSVADYYIRRQRSELDWIRDAIRTAHTIDRQRSFDQTRAVATVRDFVLRQYAYFAGTAADPRIAAFAGGRTFLGGARRERHKAHLHHRNSSIALRLSIAFSLLLVGYGLVGFFFPALLDALPEEERWHGGMMFSIGITAATAALVHEYSTRRGHEAQARRYELMAGIYRRALDALDASEQRPYAWSAGDEQLLSPLETARACILELGLEALSENGDWLLLHRELPIKLIAVH